jgi:hypothetical protein
MRIKGLDKLKRTLEDLAKALSSLDGELGNVSFDPNDPQSIELAIQSMESLVDERVGSFGKNEAVQHFVDAFKETNRRAILDCAAKARTNSEIEE